jgi:hypothetical protein
MVKKMNIDENYGDRRGKKKKSKFNNDKYNEIDEYDITLTDN